MAGCKCLHQDTFVSDEGYSKHDNDRIAVVRNVAVFGLACLGSVLNHSAPFTQFC